MSKFWRAGAFQLEVLELEDTLESEEILKDDKHSERKRVKELDDELELEDELEDKLDEEPKDEDELEYKEKDKLEDEDELEELDVAVADASVRGNRVHIISIDPSATTVVVEIGSVNSRMCLLITSVKHCRVTAIGP